MVAEHVAWKPSYRLIAARLPRIDIFEAVTDPADLDAILELEALTNPRINFDIGLIANIAPGDRVTGPGSSYIMAPFAYPSTSRFSDAHAGGYYAAIDLQTAIAEISFHRASFAATTPTPPMDFDERIIEADIDAELLDIRGEPKTSFLYDPNPTNYGMTQGFARTERAKGVGGIVYLSVRRDKGQCVVLFVPRLVMNAKTAGYIGLRWDGHKISDTYSKTALWGAYP